jgi:hypothetical protein
MLSRSRQYDLWIAMHVLGDVTGQCEMWVQRMHEAFHELTPVRGHVHPVDMPTSPGKPQGSPHWWLTTTGGEVVDPTQRQFPWPLIYDEWDETVAEPTGQCPNCGGYCYEGRYLCSDTCERSYTAYCYGCLGR